MHAKHSPRLLLHELRPLSKKLVSHDFDFGLLLYVPPFFWMQRNSAEQRGTAAVAARRRTARNARDAAAAALAQRKADIAVATERARIRGFWSDYYLKLYRMQMDVVEAEDRMRAAGIPLPPAPPTPAPSFSERMARRNADRAAKAAHDRKKSQRVGERPVVRCVSARIVHPYCGALVWPSGRRVLFWRRAFSGTRLKAARWRRVPEHERSRLNTSRARLTHDAATSLELRPAPNQFCDCAVGVLGSTSSFANPSLHDTRHVWINRTCPLKSCVR
jgi:hypothetical protein